MKRTFMTMIAVIAIVSATFVGCGKEQVEVVDTTSKTEVETSIDETEKDATEAVAETYVKGLEDISIQTGSKSVDYLENLTYDEDVVLGIVVDDSAVNLEKDGEYDVTYAITVADDEETNVITKTVVVTVSTEKETSDKDVKEDKVDKTPAKTETAKADSDKTTTKEESKVDKSEPTKAESTKPATSDKKPSTSTSKPATTTTKPSVTTTTSKPSHTHTWVTVTDKPAWSEKVLVKDAYAEKVVTKKAWSEKTLVKDAWSEKTLVKDAYTEKVVVKDAWSEKVLVKAEVVEEIPVIYVTRSNTNEVRKFYTKAEMKAYVEDLASKGISSSWHVDVETKVTPAEYKTVNHPAEYKTVDHPAEYKTVNHPAEYKTVNHPAEYKNVNHPAEYKTVTHKAVTHQECSSCGAKK